MTRETRTHVLEAEGLGKAYRLWPSPAARVREALSFGLARAHTTRWAIADVDLSVARGGALGIVGANGAGKSTLLRVLSGATAPNAGRFRSAGRVAGLLELGTGFHPDFSGRENVLMNGALLGRGRREMKRRMGEILAFADLEDVADEPLRSYSTGMAMRLGFATALGADPHVLLLDEVFAVGDLRFQKRCVDRLIEFKRDGGAILLASHSLYDVRQLCDEAVWLRDGRVAASGAAAVVTNEYSAWYGDRGAAGSGAGADPDVPRVVAVSLHDAATGEPVERVPSGGSLELRAWWRNPAGGTVNLGFTLTRQDATLASGLATHLDGIELQGAEGCCVLRLPRLALLAGTFTVVCHLFDAHGVHRHHEYALGSSLVVHNDSREVGLVRLEHEWRTGVDHPLPVETEGVAA